MRTLLLTSAWDLQLDASGQIAMAEGPLAVAQSVANAIRLFTRDAYFDQTSGVPHFDIELGHRPSPEVVKERLVRAALEVQDVDAATITTFEVVDRVATGSIEIQAFGETVNVAF
ncbi:hypothetical protein NNO07_22465 [Pseudomonas resinovorans]|uniref:DUF2634 domain-containing protein n=1 Tax=Metapseudomonas resinovorans TaxID=53412 RepID=A0ABT4YAD0_METRE|nr:hypothetical protein [Pseudomonas resinovorans]MDA8485840.1 hypothetical protein [Pseudomonas resinovorans]